MRLPNDKTLLNVIVGSIFVAAGTILLEVWFSLLSEGAFAKILITCAVVAVAAGILKAINSDMVESTKDKDQGFFN